MALGPDEAAQYLWIPLESLGLVDAEDQAAMERLKPRLRKRKCAAWLGSGMSQPLYKSWDELLEGIGEAAGLAREPGEGGPAFVQRCKVGLEEAAQGGYAQALAEVFHPMLPAHLCMDRHYELVRTGFVCYVTTNFDRCMEHAAREDDVCEWHAWPETSPASAIEAYEERHLYHIHGVDTSQAPYGPACGFPNVVLASEEYAKAYNGDDRLWTFLRVLWSSVSVLFCGYGFREETFLQVVEHYAEAEAKVQQNVTGLGGSVETPEHFALWRCEADWDEERRQLKVEREIASGTRNEVRARFERHVPHFTLTPILYADGGGGSHHYLNRILRHLARECAYRKPRTLP